MLGGVSDGCKENSDLRCLVRRGLRGLERLQEVQVMALTEAQKRAQRKYVRESVKQMTVRFYPSESSIWEWLNA